MSWTVRLRRGVALLATIAATAGVAVAVAAPAAAESLPQVTVADSAIDKPATGTVRIGFSLRLTHASKVDVKVQYATSDDSALVDRDYQSLSGSATIPAGSLTGVAFVTIPANPVTSGTKSFRFNLVSAQNATIVRSFAYGTIIDTNPPSYVSVSDTAVIGTYLGSATATFPVRLSAPSANTVQVRYGTSDGNARAGQQYVATSGTLTFAPGVTALTVSVPVLGRVAPGARWYFSLSLTAPVNTAIANAVANAYLSDSDPRAYLTVDDTVVARPATGTTTGTVTVRLTQALAYDTTVNWSTSNGTAVAGTDYTATAGTLTFAAGQTSKTVSVTVLGNAATGTRYLNLSLSSPTLGGVVLRSAYLFILAPGTRPQVSVRDTGLARPDAGTAPATFTITANPAPTSSLTVNYATADSSAQAGTDYTATSGSVTFAAGETSKTVPVPVKGTRVPRGEVAFALTISSGGNADLQRTQALAEITPGTTAQFAPTVSVLGGAATVPTSGNGPATFTLRLTPASANSVTVNYATSNNNAQAGIDYSTTSGTATFAPGETETTVDVPLLPKTTSAGDIGFYLNISAPTNAALGNTSQYLVLHNANTAPVISVGDAAAYSNPSGTPLMEFPLKLSKASTNTVSVSYHTSDNNAVAGTDYSTRSGTLTFAPGQRVRSVLVPLLPNTSAVGQRNFYLFIDTPVNASITQSYAQGYVLNGLAKPFVSVVGTTVVTGASATTATFGLVLSTPAAAAVTVNYTTNNESAVAGVQYTGTSGSVTIPAGSTTATVDVPVAADTLSTQNTRFYLQITGVVNGTVSSAYYGYAYLEHSAVLPRLSVNDVVTTRQTSGSKNAGVVVTLSPASTGTVTVNYNTSDNNAVAGTDYTATSGTLTFAPGETSKTVPVPLLAQPAATPDRNFYLSINGPTNAVTSRPYALIQIESPTAPTSYLSVRDAVATAPTTGTATAAFVLTITPTPTAPVTVAYSTTDNGAREGVDYTGTQGTTTFSAGTATKTVTVPVLAHNQASPDLGFTLNAGVTSGPATNQRTQAAGTILTPVPAAQLAGGPDVTVVRGTATTKTATVTVNLSSAQPVPVTVQYQTADNDAVADRDYVATSGQVTFAAGQTSRSVSITVEPSVTATTVRTFYVQWSDARGAGLGGIDDARTYVYLDPADSWVITGQVVSPSGAPVAGVTVTRTGNKLPTTAAVTDATGTYTLTDSTIGTYTLTAVLAGLTFAPASQSVKVTGGNLTADPFIGYGNKSIVVRALKPSGSEPVAGVTVTRSGGSQPTATLTTNAQGYVVFGPTPNGTYSIALSGGAYTTYVPSSASATVANNSPSLEFLGALPTSVSGRVTTSGGAAVAGVSVTRTGSTAKSTTTVLGYYVFSQVPAGSITVTPTKAGSTFTPATRTVSVPASGSVTGVDFTSS